MARPKKEKEEVKEKVEKRCEEGVLIASPDLKCDHNVLVSQQCQDCDEAVSDVPQGWKDDEVEQIVGTPTISVADYEKLLEDQLNTLQRAHLEEKSDFHQKIKELEKELDIRRKFDIITDEQKEAIKFCLEWIGHFRRRSNAVEFRRGAQNAISVLSKLI